MFNKFNTLYAVSSTDVNIGPTIIVVISNGSV